MLLASNEGRFTTGQTIMIDGETMTGSVTQEDFKGEDVIIRNAPRRNAYSSTGNALGDSPASHQCYLSTQAETELLSHVTLANRRVGLTIGCPRRYSERVGLGREPCGMIVGQSAF